MYHLYSSNSPGPLMERPVHLLLIEAENAQKLPVAELIEHVQFSTEHGAKI